jgi:hypothetical protein
MRRRQQRIRSLALLVVLVLASFVAWRALRPPLPVPVVVGTIADFPPGSATSLQLPASFFDTTHLPNGDIVDLGGMSFPQRTIEAAKVQWSRRTEPVVGAVDPVSVYIVNDPQQGVLALYQRDPQSTCLVPWQNVEERFIDPCHGSHYSYTGQYIQGPSWRGLDRFVVTMNERGEVIVDVGRLVSGKRVW